LQWQELVILGIWEQVDEEDRSLQFFTCTLPDVLKKGARCGDVVHGKSDKISAGLIKGK
jgi:hypothetical protein